MLEAIAAQGGWHGARLHYGFVRRARFDGRPASCRSGHQADLHARNDARANDARKAVPKAEAIVVGDLATIAGAKDVARQVNALGRFDAVIHNAAVGYREDHRLTSDGLPHVFAINMLAPYLLTALIERPKRLVYLSSGMHDRAHANLDDILWRKRHWDGSGAYAESKLHDVMLAFAVGRLSPNGCRTR
jgi:NAD(P)-dependent dehydrogenase (short-subunit alcohol dehydrogenase family)